MEENLTHHSIVEAEIKTRDFPPPPKRNYPLDCDRHNIMSFTLYYFNQLEQMTLFLSSHFYVLTFVNICRIYRLFQFGRMISVDECGAH